MLTTINRRVTIDSLFLLLFVLFCGGTSLVEGASIIGASPSSSSVDPSDIQDDMPLMSLSGIDVQDQLQVESQNHNTHDYFPPGTTSDITSQFSSYGKVSSTNEKKPIGKTTTANIRDQSLVSNSGHKQFKKFMDDFRSKMTQLYNQVFGANSQLKSGSLLESFGLSTTGRAEAGIGHWMDTALVPMAFITYAMFLMDIMQRLFPMSHHGGGGYGYGGGYPHHGTGSDQISIKITPTGHGHHNFKSGLTDGDLNEEMMTNNYNYYDTSNPNDNHNDKNNRRKKKNREIKKRKHLNVNNGLGAHAHDDFHYNYDGYYDNYNTDTNPFMRIVRNVPILSSLFTRNPNSNHEYDPASQGQNHQIFY